MNTYRTHPLRGATAATRRAFLLGTAFCGCGLLLPVGSARARTYCLEQNIGFDANNHIPLSNWPHILGEVIRNEIPHLERFFRTRGRVYIVADSELAYADGTQQFIAVGDRLVESYGRIRLAKITGLLAHEKGHLFQTGWNFDGVLLDTGGHHVKYVELHADYLAGCYKAWRGQTRAVDAQALSGDFYRLGDRKFGSKNHHGTHPERFGAFVNGFLQFKDALERNRNADVKLAAAMGLKYVQALLQNRKKTVR